MHDKPIIWLFWFLLITSIAGASDPTVAQWSDNEDIENSVQSSKSIIGMIEPVRIIPGNIVLTARIDTGANTSSLHAEGLQIINKDGVEWAHFSLYGQPMDAKIIKFVRIKQHGAASERRPVIQLRVNLGNVSEIVRVTLTDRSNFKYKMLIGRNLLYDRFLVDVSLKNTSEPSTYESP